MELKVSNINFGYNKSRIILNNVSFQVNASENISIVGASGCGKSTLLRVASGLLPNNKENVFSGNVLIDKKDISKEKDFWLDERSKGHIGFMFQTPELLPFLNVEDNIALSLDIIKGHVESIPDFLIKTDLSAHKKKLPHQLSGGMKTRVAIARTFITGPKLLFLDEPFSALDIVWRSKLYKELKMLKTTNNTTIVLVTHDIFEAMYFSKNILILNTKGEIDMLYTINEWKDNLDYDTVIQQYYNHYIAIKKRIGI